MYADWRSLPAETVWNIIEAERTRSQSLLIACIRLLDMHDYTVGLVDNPFCMVNHWEKIVALPAAFPECHEKMLLHETAEVLLRLPVAPEFHYQPTWRDEFHEVAKLVETLL